MFKGNLCKPALAFMLGTTETGGTTGIPIQARWHLKVGIGRIKIPTENLNTNCFGIYRAFASLYRFVKSRAVVFLLASFSLLNTVYDQRAEACVA